MSRIRCTHKLLKFLGKEAARTAREDQSDESDLDWYANLFYVEGRKCLIFTNVGTLASFVALDVLKKDVANLPSFFRGRYRDFLGSLEATADQIEHELESYQDLEIGKSSNRRVLGCMTEFVHHSKWSIASVGGLAYADAAAISAALMLMPMGHPNYVHPIEELGKRVQGIRSMADSDDYRRLPWNALSHYLMHSQGLAGSFGYHGVRGFFFALLTCPRVIPTEDWLHVLLLEDGEAPEFESKEQADQVFGLLMEEHNRIAESILVGEGVPPADCPLDDRPMFNFYPGSAVSRWSLGFRHGFHWLSGAWRSAVSAERYREAVETAEPLQFFANRQMAMRDLEEQGLPPDALEPKAKEMRDRFFEAGRKLVKIGRPELDQPRPGGGNGQPVVSGWPAAMGDGGPVQKVGRNDPCPCGSGKKYKRCHGGG